MAEVDKAFAAALGRVPSGVFVVTVADGDRASGMLASWLQQCSFQPPRVTLAVQPTRPIVSLLTERAHVVVNVLEASQTDMIAHFGKGFSLSDDAFVGLDLIREPGKAPILREALACLEGRVVQRTSVGDHDLFVVELSTGRLLGEGQPMTHVRKSGFHY